jgi:uncharacterized protein with NRDE domain
MCLIVFAWQRHVDYPLVFAGNRDEFLARPTEPAHWWPGAAPILAGRDLEGGGTWCGVSASGRLAALTNFRAPSERNPDAPSRGVLVSGFLQSRERAQDHLTGLAQRKSAFNGFNLLGAEQLDQPEKSTLWIDSNRAHDMPRRLEAGLYGVSNAQLDTPWPKVVAAKARLNALLQPHVLERAALIAALFAMLADPQTAPYDALPATGVSLEAERSLSAAFIRMPGYGTRTSTVILVDRAGQLDFVERSFDASGAVTDRQFLGWSGTAAPA